MLNQKTYEEAANYLRDRLPIVPQAGLILGSGLNDLENAITDAATLPYADIPHFPVPHVEGHRGRLVIGRLGGRDVIVMCGRAHYYEGYAMQEATLPIRVMQILGLRTLIVTNAAGGLNPRFHVGELMLIADHINLIGMTGHNPLRGPNEPSWGPRFPDMSEAYDAELRRIARQVAQERGIPFQEGIYAMLGGPSFETPAEIRFLRMIGADAVGMSTASEVTVARHGNMRVLGISAISNVVAGDPGADKVTHEEVLQAGAIIVPRLSALIQGVLQRL